MIRKTDRKPGNRRTNQDCQSVEEESSDSMATDTLFEPAISTLTKLVKRIALAIDSQLSRIEQIEEEKEMESEQGAYMEKFFDCEFVYGNR